MFKSKDAGNANDARQSSNARSDSVFGLGAETGILQDVIKHKRYYWTLGAIMEIDTDKIIENSIRDGIREGVKARLASGYNSPMEKLVDSAIEKHRNSFLMLLDGCLKSCMSDQQFRDDIATAVRHTLAKTLIARFGGELEKQVNVLKSDPATRARITLAIEAIVKERCAATA